MIVLKRGIPALLALASSQAARAQDAEDGYRFGFDYIGEYIGVVEGGIASGADFAGLGNLHAAFRREAWSAGANVFLPHGTSLSGRHAGDFSVASNIDTGNLDYRLAEAWLQRDFAGGSLRFGMLALDSEFWGSDGGGLFVNSVFGAPTIVSANLPNPSIFPTATLGLRAEWQIGTAGLLRVAVVDGDAGDPEADNEHGFDVAISSDQGYLMAAEYQIDWSADEGMPFVLKFGAFQHTGNFAAIADESLVHRHSHGLYAVLDQPLGDRIGWFGRVGYSRKSVAVAPWSFETGFNVLEAFGTPGTLGVALAVVDIQDEFGALVDLNGEPETIVEVTYDWPITEFFSIQPDAQYILNTGGHDEGGHTTILGVRGKLSF